MDEGQGVFFGVRHGKTDYKGTGRDILSDEEAKTAVGEIRRSLPEGARVVMWVSPTARTQATADVIEEELEKGGVKICLRATDSAIGDVRRPREEAAKVYERLGINNEAEVKKRLEWRKDEMTVPGEARETDPELLARCMNSLADASRLVEDIKKKDPSKPVVVVFVWHANQMIELAKAAGIFPNRPSREFVPEIGYAGVMKFSYQFDELERLRITATLGEKTSSGQVEVTVDEGNHLVVNGEIVAGVAVTPNKIGK